MLRFRLSSEAIGNMFESTIALGIGIGLVFGKLIGIAGSVILAEMMGVGQLPKGVSTITYCWSSPVSRNWFYHVNFYL